MRFDAASSHSRKNANLPFSMCARIQPVVPHHRVHTNPKAFDAFEFLYDEMKALLAQRVADENVKNANNSTNTQVG
jgi:hypothetical protein